MHCNNTTPVETVKESAKAEGIPWLLVITAPGKAPTLKATSKKTVKDPDREGQGRAIWAAVQGRGERPVPGHLDPFSDPEDVVDVQDDWGAVPLQVCQCLRAVQGRRGPVMAAAEGCGWGLFPGVAVEPCHAAAVAVSPGHCNNARADLSICRVH